VFAEGGETEQVVVVEEGELGQVVDEQLARSMEEEATVELGSPGV
jgi:hypothetical protein